MKPVVSGSLFHQPAVWTAEPSESADLVAVELEPGKVEVVALPLTVARLGDGSSGDTFLILAAYHRHAGTVAALLERGADTERVNDRGQTAVGAAVFAAQPISSVISWPPAPTPRVAAELDYKSQSSSSCLT